MKRIVFKKLVLFLGLVFLSACGAETRPETGVGSTAAAVEPSSFAMEAPAQEDSEPAGNPAVLPPPNGQAPSNPPAGTTPPAPPWAPPPVAQFVGPELTLSNQGAPFAAFGPLTQVSPSVVVSFDTLDTKVPLNVSYAGTAESLSDIQPTRTGGTMRFFKQSLLVASSTSFIELDFDVVYPKVWELVREEDARDICEAGNRPGPGSIRLSNRTDWIQFHLLACDASSSCREVLNNIPAQPGSTPCSSSNAIGDCEQNFHVRIDAAQLPGGSLRATHHFVVRAEGTEQADFQNECGAPQTCSRSTDCPGSHPSCEAGLCTAIQDGEFYSVETPR